MGYEGEVTGHAAQATASRWHDRKGGETYEFSLPRVEEGVTIWYRVICRGNMAAFARQNVKRGTLVRAVGQVEQVPQGPGVIARFLVRARKLGLLPDGPVVEVRGEDAKPLPRTGDEMTDEEAYAEFVKHTDLYPLRWEKRTESVEA